MSKTNTRTALFRLLSSIRPRSLIQATKQQNPVSAKRRGFFVWYEWSARSAPPVRLIAQAIWTRSAAKALAALSATSYQNPGQPWRHRIFLGLYTPHCLQLLNSELLLFEPIQPIADKHPRWFEKRRFVARGCRAPELYAVYLRI